MMIDQMEQQRVAWAMKRFGGSFVGALGVALAHADHENAAKIKATWPDYWTKYADPKWLSGTDREGDW